jgi:hypothetical protein
MDETNLLSLIRLWLDNGLVRQVKKPAGFDWFNSILWERISWNKLNQAETWPAEQGQYLLNNNKTAIVAFRQKICQLNSLILLSPGSEQWTVARFVF